MTDLRVVTCAPQELRRFAGEVLCRLGVAADDALFVADVIVNADLAGHESHGMRRLAEYVQRWRDGKVVADAQPTIDLDTGAVARMDGGSGFGQLVMRDATDLAVARAKEWGIAAIAVRRSSHAGRYADFCEAAADLGVAILFFVNDAGAGQDVAPPGGLHPRLATNPIAVGIPRARAPHLVLDMSTSVVAAGRVAEWRDRGEPIPDDWVNETGALRPVGGFKGFGLALVAEALAGALTGAGTVTANPEHDDQGVLVIALDIARLRPSRTSRRKSSSSSATCETCPSRTVRRRSACQARQRTRPHDGVKPLACLCASSHGGRCTTSPSSSTSHRPSRCRRRPSHESESVHRHPRDAHRRRALSRIPRLSAVAGREMGHVSPDWCQR